MTPDEFLISFHAAHPGVTARAFAHGRVGGGRSSYDLLADVPRKTDRVLDLGCGDGYLLERLRHRGFAAARLIGVDMSGVELDAARQRQALEGVDLRCERAQELSIEAGSVQCVVSHLAFMLMTQPEAVAGEILRVLTPGGTFATIVGGGPDEGEAFELFLELFRDVYATSATRAPRIGDKRTRHEDGLRELFGHVVDISSESHVLHLDGSAERVWETLSTIYELHVVTDAAMHTLRARFASAAKSRWPEERVPCRMKLRLLRATSR